MTCPVPSGGKVNSVHVRWLLAFFAAACLIGSAVQVPATAASGSSSQLGFIRAPAHVDSANDVFALELVDGDLNFDGDLFETYVFHVDESDLTDERILTGPLGNDTLEIRVNGGPVSLDNELDLAFIETGENTGIFVAQIMASVFDSAEEGEVGDAAVIDFVYKDVGEDPDQTTIATVVVGNKHRTYLVLNPIESVIPGFNVTASGTLYDLETGEELQGKEIILDGNGVLPINGTASSQTAGITFEGPLELKTCETELAEGVPDGSDTPDITDDVYPDCLADGGDEDGVNNVLHLVPTENALGLPGSKIILPPGIKAVTLQLQNMGNDQVTVKFTEDTTQLTVSEEIVSFSYCPDVSNLNLVSNNGIREIEVVRVTANPAPSSPLLQCNAGDGTVGISRIETFNSDSNPSERYMFDFEDLTSEISSPLTLDAGTFFITFATPAESKTDWSVQAMFAGDSSYLPSWSVTQNYATIQPTVESAEGGGGQPVTGISPDTDAGITTVSCIQDNDNDGLCNTWESTGPGAGIPYIGNDGDIAKYLLTDYYPNDPEPLHLNNPDIWVEIDCMGDDPSTSENESHCPLPSTIYKVQTAFLNQNPPIYLHYVIDDVIPHESALNVWLDSDGNDGNDFYNIKQKWFGTVDEKDDSVIGLYDPATESPPPPSLLRDNNLLKAKAQVFHYALFAHSIGPCSLDDGSGTNGTPSGLAEVNGNDFIVSLGCGFGPYDDPEAHDVGTVNEQAGTFMHELGHNLNLDHGGPREFINLSGFSIVKTDSNLNQQQYSIAAPGPGNIRSFDISNISVQTLDDRSGTVIITATVHFRDITGVYNVDPGVVTVGEVTSSYPTGSVAIVDSITPTVSDQSGGTSWFKQVTLKVRFHTTGAADASTGNLGTFTVPLIVTNPEAYIRPNVGVSKPNYSPQLTIDISSINYSMNCKVNYPSVMSYSQQFPTIYDDHTVANPAKYVWTPRYSNLTGASLWETNLDESVGLDGSKNYIVFHDGEVPHVVEIPASSVQWSKWQNGVVSSDINNFGIRGCGLDDNGNPFTVSNQVQKSFNDWDNLRYNFRAGLGSIDGIYPANTASLYWTEGTAEINETGKGLGGIPSWVWLPIIIGLVFVVGVIILGVEVSRRS